MSKASKILIIEARFYEDIADLLLDGAKAELEQQGLSFDVITVPGALEIPPAIALKAGHYDAFVALGCVIRGETSHYDIVAGESARAIMDLCVQHKHCIGNGILTCDIKDQAVKRADPKQKNKGRDAVKAALTLLDIKRGRIS